jgi:hypothetical protein
LSQSLWLTSLSSTNDKQELKMGRLLLNDVLDELISTKKDLNLLKVLKSIRNGAKNKKLRVLNQSEDYYAAAFVCIPDNLTHWERYGNQSKGVCIEFNLKTLETIFIGNLIPDYLIGWIEQKDIIYLRDQQCKLIEKYLFSRIASFDDLQELHNKNKKKKCTLNEFLIEYPIICSLLYHNILSTITPLFKHQGFSDENESRLLFYPGDAEDSIKTIGKLHLDPTLDKIQQKTLNKVSEILSELGLNLDKKKYSEINGSIRSLYSMNLSIVWSSLLIPKIIIGPKCLQNVKELKNFVKNQGLAGTKVQVSKIPIR